MANEVLDLDAVLVERTTIRKTPPGEREPREWALRDDVPPEIMLRVFRLMKHSQDARDAVQRIVASVDEHGEEGVVAATEQMERLLRDQEDETLAIALAIFQHSYPDTTAEQLRAWFTRNERGSIVGLFFTRLLPGSSNLSSAITANEPTPPTTNVSPNRATRRQSSGSGATPSQKRIKRELGL